MVKLYQIAPEKQNRFFFLSFVSLKKSRYLVACPPQWIIVNKVPPQFQTRKVHFHIFSFSFSNIFKVFSMKTMNKIKLTLSNKARCQVQPQYCWTSSTSHLIVMGCTGKIVVLCWDLWLKKLSFQFH